MTTTVYIAGIYEFIDLATDRVTKYYEGNALRRSGYGGTNDGVFYLLQDHLKSSSVFVDQSGTTVATNYYLPYGGRRGGTFSLLSTKRFTGQYHEANLTSDEGLSYYGARWYDAKLGRFLSADTIVPSPTNPQAFNRYSYVINNPLKYVDPTGHSLAAFDPGPGGGGRPQPKPPTPQKNLWTLFRDAYQASWNSWGYDVFYDGYEVEGGASALLNIGPKIGFGQYRYWDFQNNMTYQVRTTWGGISVGEDILKGLKTAPRTPDELKKLFSGSASTATGTGIYFSNTATPQDAVTGKSVAMSFGSQTPLAVAMRRLRLPVVVSIAGSTSYFIADPGKEFLTMQWTTGVGTPGKSLSGTVTNSLIVEGSITTYGSNAEMARALLQDRILHGDLESIPELLIVALPVCL